MINEMLDVRLTDLDQEDIIVYKKIIIFILKDKSLYLTEVIDIRLFSYNKWNLCWKVKVTFYWR